VHGSARHPGVGFVLRRQLSSTHRVLHGTSRVLTWYSRALTCAPLGGHRNEGTQKCTQTRVLKRGTQPRVLLQGCSKRVLTGAAKVLRVLAAVFVGNRWAVLGSVVHTRSMARVGYGSMCRFGKHIYRLRTPLTAIDSVDPRSRAGSTPDGGFLVYGSTPCIGPAISLLTGYLQGTVRVTFGVLLGCQNYEGALTDWLRCAPMRARVQATEGYPRGTQRLLSRYIHGTAHPATHARLLRVLVAVSI
jgi:hypothetical protein